MWKLYILRCGDGTLYTGITDCVPARLAAHRAGRGAKYTRGRTPLTLVHAELCGTCSDAARREHQVKKLSRQEKRNLCKEGPPMTYQEVRQAARGNMGPCLACPVCNGAACANTIPGPGAKGSGKVFARNYGAWQEILLNMDTIAPMAVPDTTFSFLGEQFAIPVFAAPIGVVRNHYGDKLSEETYDRMLIRGCREAGIAAFTGDGLKREIFSTACEAMAKEGFAVPTVKPWNRDLVFEKIDEAKKAGAKWLCMDIDAAGLPFLKSTTPPSGNKTVAELAEIIQYAGVPFILKGIMTPRGAEKAIQAGAAAIVVSNHGGRVLDSVPATAAVLPEIVRAVDGRVKILVDGGIRTGQDVFKALALGADGVLIGRPFVTAVYGAAELGVSAYVQELKSQLQDTMAMCGVASLSEIGPDCLYGGIHGAKG